MAIELQLLSVTALVISEPRERQIYEAMSQSSERDRQRAEWEKRANQPLRADRLREPGEPYVMPGRSLSAQRDRVAERLMAQANGTVWDLYQQEQQASA